MSVPAPATWTLRVAERCYAALLLLYPKPFRERFRGLLMESFRDGWLDAERHRGGLGVAAHVITTLSDLLANALEEHMGRSPVFGGGVQLEPQGTRKAKFMDRLTQDLRFAVRTLIRKPLFTAVVVATLALGVGANSAIFSVVNAILLRPLPYPAPSELVTVWQDHTRRDGPATEWASPVNFSDWRAQNTTFADMVSWSGWGPTLTGLGEATQLTGGLVSAGFFNLLGAKLVTGRGFSAEEDVPNGPNVVVVSHQFWQDRLGGDIDAVGRSVTLGGTPYSVVGILSPGFSFDLIPGAQLWSPIQSDPERCGRGCITVRVIGRLQPGIDLARAQADLATIASRLEQEFPEANAGSGITVIPFKEFLVGSVRLPLFVLLASVAFVLLVACANVANLMLARATGRTTEIAVRTALGAGRGRVLQQLLTESILLALVGGGLGLLVGMGGARVLASSVPSNLTLPGVDAIGLDGPVLLFTLGVAVMTGLIFGMIPALQASRPDLSQALRDGGRAGVSRARQRARSVLVVAEVGLAVVLLTGAGLFLRSLSALTNVDIGFQSEGVLTATVGFPTTRYPGREQLWAAQTEILERVGALPGVMSVAYTSTLPLSGADGDVDFEIEGRPPPPPDQPQVAWLRRVTPSYESAIGLRLIDGRFIEGQDNPEASGVVVVNETMARRYWPDRSPIGDRFTLGPGFTIVGVVGNVKNFGLDREEPPAIYISQGQFPTRFTGIVVKTDGDFAPLTQGLKREVAAVDPELALANIMPLEGLVTRSIGDRRAITVLTAVFASLAALLAALGIYGLMNFAVAQRTHEIGVRVTFGADRGRVLALVFGHGLKLTLVGLGTGMVGALVLSRFISSLLYGITPTDPMTYVAVPTVLGTVALLAIYIPACRATRVEPVEALRYE